MGRANFGGASDYSQLFLTIGQAYQAKIEAAAQRAIRDAEQRRAAEDAEAMNAWQAGEMTDEAWIAYAKARLAASSDDAEQTTYWKDVLRDSEERITQRRVEDGANALMDRIEEGTATWQDLRNFYTRERTKLNDGSELHRSLTEQIDKIGDTIRDNETEGMLGQADYLFRSGQINGAQAAAMIRGAAERYKNSDPGRYWQLLSSAFDFASAGSMSGGGGGGGGGGGSGGGDGGGSSGSLTATIDAIQGEEARLLSLSEQFERGDDVGSITVPDGNGGLQTVEVMLRNPDGTPSADMKAIDTQMLATLDELEAAYVAKGDQSAAGNTANRREQYVSLHIQPRNTIKPQNQAAALLQSGMSHIENAINAANPAQAWAAVRRWANTVERWEGRVNTDTKTVATKTVDEAKQRENPELGAANRKDVTTRSADADQTTGGFADQAAALLQFAKGVSKAKTMDEVRALAPLLDLMASDDAEDNPLGSLIRTDPTRSTRMIDVAAAGVDLVNGIAEGRYVRAVDPQAGLVWAPLAEDYQTVPDPTTGQPRTVAAMVPVRPDGSSLFDAAKGESLTTAIMEIGGKMQVVQVVAQPLYYMRGRDGQTVEISLTEYANLDDNEKAQVTAYQRTLIPGERGTMTWYKDVATGEWYRNSPGEGPASPMPYAASARYNVQKFAAETGLDPTARAFGGLVADRESEAQRDYDAQRDSMLPTTSRSRPRDKDKERDTDRRSLFGQPTRAMNVWGTQDLGREGRESEARRASNFLPQQVRDIGKGLGIKFGIEEPAGATAAQLRGAGAQPIDRITPSLPTAKPVATVTLKPAPKLPAPAPAPAPPPSPPYYQPYSAYVPPSPPPATRPPTAPRPM